MQQHSYKNRNGEFVEDGDSECGMHKRMDNVDGYGDGDGDGDGYCTSDMSHAKFLNELRWECSRCKRSSKDLRELSVESTNAHITELK